MEKPEKKGLSEGQGGAVGAEKKGLGEGGAIAPPVVIANAVCDALRPFKAELNSTPVRWEDVANVLDRTTA